MSDLKPCPFCGGEDVEHLPDGFGNWLVGCVTCDYRIQCVSCTEDEAIRYWNTRPAEDAKEKEIERLKAENDQLKMAVHNLLLNIEASDAEEDYKEIARQIADDFDALYTGEMVKSLIRNCGDCKDGAIWQQREKNVNLRTTKHERTKTMTELEQLQKEKKVLLDRIASNRDFISNGQKQTETLFVEVNVYGKTASTCRQFLSKGSKVLVEGRLVLKQWEKEGKQYSKLMIAAENVIFLPSNSSSGRIPAAHHSVDSQYAPPVPDAEEENPF